jgi:hypothetical protein
VRRRGGELGLAAVVGLGLGLVAGCGERGLDANRGTAAALEATPRSDDDAVATVDGRTIHVSDVALQAREAGVPARVALEQLIDAEALVSEAKRRGLDGDTALRSVRTAAEVRGYLRAIFEKEVRPETIPVRELRRGYNARTNVFDHSEYVDVWHILSPLAKHAAPAERDRARAIATEVARRARGVRSADEFKAIADAILPTPAPALKVERVITARDGWTSKAFSYPAFDQLKEPGAVSSVIETEFGYHVIYLNRRIPPRHATLDEAAAELRPALFPEFQRREFARFMDEVATHHQVSVYPDRLAR